MVQLFIRLLGLCILVTSLLQSGKAQKVKLESRLSQTAVESDSTIIMALVLTIESGWHINSANPSDESLIATSVEIETSPNAEVLVTHYPEGVKRKLAFSEEPIDVYEGTVTVFLKLHIYGRAKPGMIQLPVDVTYQACNDVQCSAPTTGRVNVPIQIVPTGAPVSKANLELFKGIFNH